MTMNEDSCESVREMLVDYDDGELPRNYWRWVSEGTEAVRVSAARTLDDFS